MFAYEAYSINPRGGYEKLDFSFGQGTQVDESCSLQWRNQYYVFGGDDRERQVSIVNNCGLERKGTLSFDFYGGACTVLNTQTIVLCFGDEMDLCRHADNPLGSFTKLKKSRYDHRYTKIVSYDGKTLFFNNYK